MEGNVCVNESRSMKNRTEENEETVKMFTDIVRKDSERKGSKGRDKTYHTPYNTTKTIINPSSSCTTAYLSTTPPILSKGFHQLF